MSVQQTFALSHSYIANIFSNNRCSNRLFKSQQHFKPLSCYITNTNSRRQRTITGHLRTKHNRHFIERSIEEDLHSIFGNSRYMPSPGCYAPQLICTGFGKYHITQRIFTNKSLIFIIIPKHGSKLTRSLCKRADTSSHRSSHPIGLCTEYHHRLLCVFLTEQIKALSHRSYTTSKKRLAG